MAEVDLIMPKMGESIMEATIIKWLKEPGDAVEVDESILEIATDKVDSEIPSPVKGIFLKKLFEENDVVEVGKIIAVISTESDVPEVSPSPAIDEAAISNPEVSPIRQMPVTPHMAPSNPGVRETVSGEKAADTEIRRFYSPLVKNMAKKEGISKAELDSIKGTGTKGRVTKSDLVQYISTRSKSNGFEKAAQSESTGSDPKEESPKLSHPGSVEIIEMDRMRKLIAEHMVRSKRTSPHVTSFVEADLTRIVEWRKHHKEIFLKKFGQNLTFTPFFIDAVVKSIKDYPMINVSVEGDKIIKKNPINIGMATALSSGNLIVPVIKNADQYSLSGLAMQVNDLATRAREHKLKPEEIQDGTFTLTNVGTFGNVMGTPIINQPQVAILATGAIRKKPAVIETEFGDVIAIRHQMFLSLSYDHRVVDGFLGGSFLRKVADYLEQFDPNQKI